VNGHELQVVWTAIPSGAHGGPRLTVLPSLRLLNPQGGDRTLADYDLTGPESDFEHCWTGFMYRASWRILVGPPDGTLQQLEGIWIMPEGWTENLRVRISMWRSLFPPETLVRPWEPSDLSTRSVRTFPVRDVLAQLRDAYRAAGNGFEGRKPPRADVERILEPARIAGLPFSEGEPTDAQLGQTPALTLARRFYERPEFEVPYQPSPTLPLRPLPERLRLDFHAMLTVLADHPLVLRLLGLAIDLIVPDLPADGRELRVAAPWSEYRPSVDVRDRFPSTRYVVKGDRFLPAPGRRFRDGLLMLAEVGEAPGAENERDYDVVQLDADGAALKLIATASSVARAAEALATGESAFDTPANETLAALRSDGIAIAERQRGRRTQGSLERDAALQSGDPDAAVLDADDLTRGYRLDVLDETIGEWTSLCSRRAVYRIGDYVDVQSEFGRQPWLDEGYIKRSSAATGPQPGAALYLHEALACWTGWSLTAPRPERPIRGVPVDPERSAAQEERWDRREPERLPPGPGDFAFEPTITAQPGSLPRLRFGRSYRLRARLVDMAGGGLTLDQVGEEEQRTQSIVRRRFDPVPPPEIVPTHTYGPGESLDRMVIRSDRGRDAASYAAEHGLPAADWRHLLAPKTSLQLAEEHGAFDAALGPHVPEDLIRRYWQIALLADGTLEGVSGSKWIRDPGAHPIWEDRPAGAYLVVPPDPVDLPWLPDIPARGLVLNDGDFAIQKAWPGSWPDYAPVRVRLEEGEQTSFEWDDERTLVARLAPASDVKFELASFVDKADVPLLGVLGWLDPNAAELALEGGHWMVTPPRPLRLVHAVQRPLSDPEGEIQAQRRSGETSALLSGTVRLHGRSTGQLDVHASWEEWSDAPGGPPPARSPREAHVASLAIDPKLPADPVRFPPSPPPSPKPGAGPSAAPQVRHEFGDTRFREITYELVAVSRFREFLPPDVADDPAAFTAHALVPRTVSVLSSARPPAPVVHSVIPTFRWAGGPAGPGWRQVERIRHGGGVRVYLERPWFESGDGELLGVLLWAGQEPPGEDIKPYITDPGRDPIWDAAGVSSVLPAAEFAGTAQPVGEPLTLPGLAGIVHAVPYTVGWSEERQMWQADIDIPSLAASSYFPFLKLGLARLQPHSVTPDLMLSPPVGAGFVQLLPERRLTASHTPGVSVHVMLDGPMPTGPDPNLLEVTVEQRDPNIGGDAGWAPWTAQPSAIAPLDHPVELALHVPGPGTGTFRLVVREWERHPADPEVADSRGDGTTRDRLVFAEVLAL
jgi:YD repeat-containing protein